MHTPSSLLLASEIAAALEDTAALPLYEGYAQCYPEALLRELLRRTLSIPDHKIKRSRGALFTYLVQQHANHHRSPRP